MRVWILKDKKEWIQGLNKCKTQEPMRMLLIMTMIHIQNTDKRMIQFLKEENMIIDLMEKTIDNIKIYIYIFK